MTSYRFHFRPSAKAGRNPGTLFIRIIHRRRYKDIPCEYTVYPDEWDPAQRTVKLSGSDPDRGFQLGGILKSMQTDTERLDKIVDSLRDQGDFSVRDISERFPDRSYGSTIGAFTRKVSDEVNAEGRPRTARAYRSAVRSISHFTGGDIELSRLNPSLIRAYEHYLQERGLKMNTISFYMRNLRAIYYRAVREGILPSYRANPFEGVFTGVYQTKRRALDRQDMDNLASLDRLLTEKLRESGTGANVGRDGTGKDFATLKSLKDAMMYYMFAFHSRGMSFVDLAYLRKSDVGKDSVVYKRKKTGFYMEVKITAPMRRIMNYFRKDTANSPYVFPLIRAVKASPRTQYETGLKLQNKRLKILAAMAGIGKNLSTHVARHTWATLAKRLGYSVGLISEGLGHRDTKVTSVYLASFDRSALDELSTRLSSMVKIA